jgi:O-antigen biosynthesis protein
MPASIRLASPRSDVGGADSTFGCDPRDLAKAGFFDAGRHNEALALLCAEALRIGRPDAAFRFADRRCRLPLPTAYDLLLRANASRLMNETSYAQADLARAFEIDPTHDLVISNVLAWGALALRPIAAASFVEGASEDPESLRLAMQVLGYSAEAPIVSRLRVCEGMHQGWVAWRGEGALELIIRRSGKSKSFELEPDTTHPLTNRTWSAAQIAIEIESPRLESVTFRLDGRRSNTIFPAQDGLEAAHQSPSRGKSASAIGYAHHVEVIVPVYGDYAATKACLDALEVEDSRIARHVTVIDDCSPDANIRALVEDRAARGLFTLVRNQENIGFARSVNRVLKGLIQCDVLLLNADTVLPRRAIDRLAMAAYSEARVATVTPLSNNGEFTSFPKPNVFNTLPSKEEIRALDDIARATNGHEVVDLPSGVGFCLYITRACVEVVGSLSENYSRGYYEDVDYCLRAREAGLRNVCATGVYVGHAGSRSFRSDKRSLVVRNLKTLNERFPNHELECVAFIRADPLRSARAKIEEQLTPKGTVVLLSAPAESGRALALERARQIEEQGCDLHCIHCEFDDGNVCVTIKSIRESAPQSLTFSLSDGSALVRLQAYLRRLRPQAIELLAPHALPDAALRVAFALQIPVRLALGDLDWMFVRDFAFGRACPHADRPGHCPTCVCPGTTTPPPNKRLRAVDRRRTHEVMSKAESLVPMDRMAHAFCAAYLKSRTLAHLAPQQNSKVHTRNIKRARTILGVLCPEATAETHRQILALERAFDQQCMRASIIVLGRCLYELGIMSGPRIFVTGVVDKDEYERVLRQYGITHLLSPYRTRHFGLVDRLSAAFGLSKGYFDWSFGVMDRNAGDLAIDPRICFERAALEIGAWLADRPIKDVSATADLSR